MFKVNLCLICLCKEVFGPLNKSRFCGVLPCLPLQFGRGLSSGRRLRPPETFLRSSAVLRTRGPGVYSFLLEKDRFDLGKFSYFERVKRVLKGKGYVLLLCVRPRFTRVGSSVSLMLRGETISQQFPTLVSPKIKGLSDDRSSFILWWQDSCPVDKKKPTSSHIWNVYKTIEREREKILFIVKKIYGQ